MPLSNPHHPHHKGTAIEGSIPLDTGISCKNCYSYMGAGIMIIVQYGYNGDAFDFEVKAGGWVGLSAHIAMKDPIVSSMKDKTLLKASTTYSSFRLGTISLGYKFGGLTASLSGSGSATGSLEFGASRKVFGSQGLLYTSRSYYEIGDIKFPQEYSRQIIPPYSKSSSLETTSLSVTLALRGVENFFISYSYISIAFDASIQGTISHSLGSSGDASVSVFSDTAGKRVLTADCLKNGQESPLEAQLFNFLPGDVTVILFEYRGFNPSEEIILFYSVQRSDAEYPIMQKNFTTSKSGSGIFEGSWTVPWDYILAGVGTNDTVISVRATNSISKTFNSELFGLSVFTESDGIFSSPRASEVILIDTPYTLRWAADLLHYFQPNSLGGLLGDDVVATHVVFEVVAEKQFINGSVKSSMIYQNLTQGPVNNTGECFVTFQPALLDMGNRFYINVKSTKNSDTYGWSKSYFTLKKEKGSLPHTPVLSTQPVMLSVKKTLSPMRGLRAAPSVSDPLSKASRSLSTGCSPGQGEVTFKLDGLLALSALTISVPNPLTFGYFYIDVVFNLAFIRPLIVSIAPLQTSCIGSPTTRPTTRPTNGTPPPSTTPPPSAAPVTSMPSYEPSYRPTRDPAFIPFPVIATLNHRYSFNSIAVTDSIGGADGTIVGLNVKIESTIGSGRAIFSGDPESAVMLPPRILEPTALSGATAFSIEVWFSTRSADINSESCPQLFEFGTEGTDDGSVGVRRSSAEPEIGYIDALALGATNCTASSKMLFDGASNLHLVLTYALGGSVKLYVGGDLTMWCSGAISESAYDMAVSTETNYLGRSLQWGEEGLTGSIDEFRVWNGELPAESVVANYKAGPDHIVGETDAPTSFPTAVPTATQSAAPTAIPTATPSAAPTQIKSSYLSATHKLLGLNSTGTLTSLTVSGAQCLKSS
jgi:Concanavalin A-like lectin/glucanases superfamily